MYQKINPEIEKKIQNIIKGDYEISVLGTNGKDNFPFLSKIIPMYKNDKLYLLISDLSEHTQNIVLNHNVSIYFSLKELNKTKSNNPRLTINGIIKKHVLKKKDKEFIDLLNTYQKIENGSKMWGMFTDFNFYSLIPKRALYIEGFGKAYQKVYE
jgi:putative heme iron utilization protein